MTAQHIMEIWTIIERLLTHVTTVMLSNNTNIWKVQFTFLNFSNVEVYIKVHNWWFHHSSLFSCINIYSKIFICRSLTQLELFILIERTSSVHSITCIFYIYMKRYGGTNIWILPILFWTWRINMWILPKKNAKRISKMVIHILIMDMHILLP